MKNTALAFLAAAVIFGCASAGQKFSVDSANLVRNGMSREEVVALMGAQPNSVRDSGSTLIWSYSSVGVLGGQENRTAIFKLDSGGKTYGIPDVGIFNAIEEYNRNISPKFPEAEYEALPVTGTGVLTGQAFLRTVGGDVKTAAGREVILQPATSYAARWWGGSEEYLVWPEAQLDPRLDRYLRKQTADASGRFSFKNIPAGDYFVSAPVTWQRYVPSIDMMRTEGGVVYKRVTIGGSDPVEVILTR